MASTGAKVALDSKSNSIPSPQAAARSGLLPLILGVTGHRDLRQKDIPELRRRVQQALRLIQQQWVQSQNGAGAPIILLSALAAGADQLAAEVALKEGLEVIAALPMPLEEYEKDFNDPGDLAALHALLRRVSRVITVPADASRRDFQYQAAGAYISRHCCLLLALWDGVHVQQVGGTSHVVRMKLFGEAPEGPGSQPTLEPSASGPVCHIPTSRQNSTLKTESAICVLRAAGEGSAVKSSSLERDLGFQATLRKLGAFNADWSRLAGRLGGLLQTAGGDLWTPSESSRKEESLLVLFSVADALASHFQVLSIRVVKSYFRLVLLAGILRSIGERYRQCTYASLVAMATIWAIFLYARRRDFHNRYHEYRALAEALRVQVFWRVAGLSESVADHYLTHQADDLSWICLALRAINLRLSAPQSENLPVVREKWVKNQLDYFKQSVKRSGRYARLLSKAGAVALFIAAPWAVLKIVVDSILKAHGDSGRLVFLWVSALLGSTSTIAIAFIGYNNIRGFAEHSRRHTAMIPFLETANRSLANPHSREGARQMILQLGREALAENGYWLILHHQRKLDAPK